MKKPSKTTERLIQSDKAHLWHPFTQMGEWCDSEQLVIERGRGNYLYDTEGNKYLDGVSSLWVTVHGHNRPEINRAVKAQLGKVAHSTLLGLTNVPAVELAKRLVEITPKALTRVFYSDSGSTAVEIALKMAYQYWSLKGKKSKKKFISFTGAYHGDTFGSMSVGGEGIFTERFKPYFFDTLRAPYPYCYRCPLKKEFPSCSVACLGEFEKIIKKSHRSVAACVMEPVVQGAAGIIVSPPGFLKEVRALCKKYDVLFIADEVATGFGRTGEMFACGTEGVEPDLMCLAKGMTGGYLPVAATLATENIYRAFLGRYDEYKAFFHGHTYTGNPLGCAAAVANLDIFKKEKTIKKIQPAITELAKGLEGLRQLPHVGDVRQKGLMAGIEIVQNKRSKRPFDPKKRVGHLICMEARRRGVIIRPLGDVIVLMPPLSITAAQIKKLVTTVSESTRKVTGTL